MRNRVPDLLLLVCLAASGLLLLWAGTGLTFFFDEWQVLLAADPLSPSTLLEPHNGQVFVLPALIYGIWLEVFGMASQAPYRIVTVLAATGCALLLYLLVRERVSPWFALVMILPVLGLGAAWEALLLALSMNFLIGLACGLGMLLALESRSYRGDSLACLLLAGSLACGGIGLAFLAGALADVLVRRDPRRLWIPALPALLFVAWYLGTGDQAGGATGIGSPLELPGYLLDASLSAVRAATGMSGDHFPARIGDYLAPLILLGVLIATAWRIWFASRPVSNRALVVGSVLLAFWVLGGLAIGEGRGPEASRYQYPATVLLIAFVACLLDGIRTPRWLPAAILPLVLLGLASNLVVLRDGREFLMEQTEITRAALGQVEADAGGIDFTLTEEVAGSPYQRLIETSPYLKAADRWGSPAFDRDGIESSGPEGKRAAAGVAMAAALARRAD